MPRFLKGRILIEGTKTIAADKLRDLLQAKEDAPKAPVTDRPIREAMAKEEKWLPKPESKAAKDMLEALNQQLGALKWSISAGNSEAEER